MLTMKTLVIIDMQGYYLYQNSFSEKENREVLVLKRNICDLIKKFKDSNLPIIVVEYEGNGPTINEIRHLLVDYSESSFLIKGDCDGSDVIHDEIQKRDFSNNLNVCGIYSDQCVKQTVEGLLNICGNYSIELYNDCVWPFDPDYENYNYSIDFLGSLRAERVLV